MIAPHLKRHPYLRQSLAWVCALTVWALGVFAASPELHHELHHDCCEPEHTCAITLFSQGAEEAVLETSLVCITPIVVQTVACPDAWVEVGEAWRLPPGCGPPRR